MNNIKMLLSLVANLDGPLHQLDVKNVFLNADIKEEVYMVMDAPLGFGKSYELRQVCKLKKSLYGLKQSPRTWFERLTKHIKRRGYSQSQADHTMFFRHFNSSKRAILIVYVNDLFYFDALSKLKNYSPKKFEIKDLGHLKYFLRMEMAKSGKDGNFVTKKKKRKYCYVPANRISS